MVLVGRSRYLMAWVVLHGSGGLRRHGCCGGKIGMVMGLLIGFGRGWLIGFGDGFWPWFG